MQLSTLPRLLATFLLLFLSATISQAQWVTLNSGTYTNLRDVYFIDRDLGWVIGDSGLVYKTTDGGTSWTPQQFPTIANLASATFPNADTGYILPEFGSPYRTTNGGTTWVLDSIWQNGCFGSRVRHSGSKIYLVSQGCFGGTWINTYDMATGDTTELFDYSPSPFGVPYFNDVGFPDTNTAVALGAVDMRGRTTDGGDTWAITISGDTLLNWQAVDFTAGGVGHAITTDEFWPLNKTTDGGLTWFRDTTWTPTFFYPTCTDVDFLNADYGYVTTNVQWAGGGLIFEIRPGLAFFNYYSTDHVARAIYMVDDSVGYVVGDSGMILKRVGGPLAVSEAEMELGFLLYPNPNAGSFQVDWPSAAQAELQVLALDGRVLHTQALTSGRNAVATRGLARGMYLVRVQSDGKVSAKRWVKE